MSNSLFVSASSCLSPHLIPSPLIRSFLLSAILRRRVSLPPSSYFFRRTLFNSPPATLTSPVFFLFHQVYALYFYSLPMRSARHDGIGSEGSWFMKIVKYLYYVNTILYPISFTARGSIFSSFCIFHFSSYLGKIVVEMCTFS